MRKLNDLASVSRVPLARPQETARGASIPVPIEGWDAISPIAAMSPKRAVRMVNWFPQASWVELRKGFVRHANTLTETTVDTVLVYQGVMDDRMFAASEDGIFDVTDAGSAPADVTGLANARFQWINFTTTGGSFLLAVNGVDDMQVFDGLAWSEAAITGAGPFINIAAHKSRVWLIEDDATKAYYLPLDSYQGAASSFELGGLMTLGGYLMAVDTWSLDAGNGPQDYIVFITSRGQAIIYQGDDPASDFTLVNVYNIGPPIGRRCLLRVGADLAVICIDGVVPLSKAIIFERAAVVKVSLTENIQRVMVQSARDYGDNFGWQLISYPRGTRAILNVPVTEGVLQEQYVMNTLTGAWCKFEGMNANCWAVFNDRLFFGGNDGSVYEADRSGNDYQSVLSADMMTAFNYFGSRGIQKRFTMCRPLITTDGTIHPGIAFNVDFREDASIQTPTSAASAGAKWDQAAWDEVVWPGFLTTEGRWTSVTGIGYCASVRMTVNIENQADGEVALWHTALWGEGLWAGGNSDEIVLQVNAFDLLYEAGGFI